MDRAADPIGPLDALVEEAKAIYGPRFGESFHALLDDPECPADRAFDKALASLEPKPAALCLSGGGIRSATFCLGILQGLARSGVLQQFHYLSTVSGGGYIGSWVSRWIREAKGGLKEVEEKLAARDEEEPPPIKHLRAHGSYLAPRRGLSKDLLTLIGIFLRNLLLNWVVRYVREVAILSTRTDSTNPTC